MAFWTLQILNGISFGMLLFLLAAGLTMIFGLLGIVNLAHGSFYLLGAYVGLTISNATGSLLLAALSASIALGVIGSIVYRQLLQRFQQDHRPQVLLTFGLLFIFGDLALWIWGGMPQAIAKPAFLSGAVQIGSLAYPKYRLALVVIGLVIAALLWWFQERTKLGAVVRAGVDDIEMAGCIGINVPLLLLLVFGMGALLAGLSGVLGGAYIGVYPGVDLEVLLLAFIVVIVGGLGSLKGAFVAAILIGLLDNFGKALFPELSMFTLFAPMAVILAVKPTGLFGRA